MSLRLAVLLLGLALPAVSMAETATEFAQRLYEPKEDLPRLDPFTPSLYVPEIQPTIREFVTKRDALIAKHPNVLHLLAQYPILTNSLSAMLYKVIRESPGDPKGCTVVIEGHYMDLKSPPSQYIILQVVPAGSSWQIFDIHFVHLSSTKNPQSDTNPGNLLESLKEHIRENGSQ